MVGILDFPEGRIRRTTALLAAVAMLSVVLSIAAASPAGAGELWTPDSAAPAPAGEGDTGNKLWVPGMD